MRLPSGLIALLLSVTPSLSGLSPAYADDPASHCASVRNDDKVQPIPPELVSRAIQLFGLAAEDPAFVRKSTVYRCMGGAAWLCNHGANLPCAKGAARRSLPSVTAYCRENRNADFVPAAVTGHGTIYSWACVHGRPRITQSEKVDARGFVIDQWKRL